MTVTRHPNNQGVTLSQWRYNATGGETTLSGTDAFGAGLSYTVGAEQVFVNGVLLERGVDYTASTGTTVTGLTALVAGDIVTVSSPSAFNVANAIPKATVAAKGDLIVANGAASVTNLGVGADGTTLVANSSAGGGVSWAGPSVAGGKNLLINGGFDIWQRGTTFAANTSGYYMDRWNNDNANSNYTVTQQSSNPPAGSRYYVRYTVANSSNPYVNIQQFIETGQAQQAWGNTVTFSIKVRRNSTFAGTYAFQIDKSSTIDAGLGATWTTIGSVSVPYTSLSTTNWTTFTITAAVPNDGTANSLRIHGNLITITTTVGDYIEFAQAQLELGSIPTTFSRAGGTLQGELNACLRYYARYTGGEGLAYAPISYSSSLIYGNVGFPVVMRTAPSAGVGGTIYCNEWISGGASSGAASPTIDYSNLYAGGGALRIGGFSGLTAGRANGFYFNGGYVEMSAEL